MTTTMPIACVIGWPVKHSRSPVIHRFWLRELGLTGDYVLQPVEPDDVAGFFRDLPAGRYVGCNVTVPHKEAAFAAVARREAAAEETGALNTIWVEDGRLVGTNTDPIGFLANLDDEAPGWDAKGGPAIVLGAGGAARAIVWALLSRGFAPVTVVNRTPQRAEAFAVRFGKRVVPAGFDKLPALLGRATLLVNTTTLGMHGQPPLRVDLSPMADTAVVNDLVYVPMDTPLLMAARARGLRAVGGLGMLLHQAVTGFEHWFGQRPQVTPALRAAVQKSIEAG
jgi:shikimate dehydrogenase